MYNRYAWDLGFIGRKPFIRPRIRMASKNSACNFQKQGHNLMHFINHGFFFQRFGVYQNINF